MKNRLGIYIHIPFCKQKCFYCDFPSYAGKEAEHLPYVEALQKEIASYAEVAKDWSVKSVFIGGGTPTVLSGEALQQIMRSVFDTFQIEETAEITVEANPGTLDKAKVLQLKQMGINRVSMGVQAWQNNLLKQLGRIHNIAEVEENIQALQETGLHNINMDLMFALPNQTFADWKETLESAIAKNPYHISAYSLIIEEGTPFYRDFEDGKFLETDEDLDRQMYHFAVKKLQEAGYHQYEISNFAKDGYESVHNKIYWETTPYLGLGLGAHSFFEGKRFHNTYDMAQYIRANGDLKSLQEELETLTKQDEMGEFMFLGLRMTRGVCFDDFLERFGVEITTVYGGQMEQLLQDGLLQQEGRRICLTEKGVDLSNRVFSEFLLDEA